MRYPIALLLASSITAIAPLHAQRATPTVSPGMSRAQVVSALGQPLAMREADGYAYLFYRNHCTRTCGMNDLVVLHRDSVVDAIFRSPARRYAGTSSSPVAIPARVAARGNPGASEAPRPVRMQPGPPNDVRPSIPLNPPQLKPAPAEKAAGSLQTSALETQ